MQLILHGLADLILGPSWESPINTTAFSKVEDKTQAEAARFVNVITQSLQDGTVALPIGILFWKPISWQEFRSTIIENKKRHHHNLNFSAWAMAWETRINTIETMNDLCAKSFKQHIDGNVSLHPKMHPENYLNAFNDHFSPVRTFLDETRVILNAEVNSYLEEPYLHLLKWMDTNWESLTLFSCNPNIHFTESGITGSLNSHIQSTSFRPAIGNAASMTLQRSPHSHKIRPGNANVADSLMENDKQKLLHYINAVSQAVILNQEYREN